MFGESQVAEEPKKQVLTNLRMGVSKYDTMNPLISTNKTVQYVDKLIFEPLLTLNNDFTLSNCLAKEYSKTGDNTYLIKLRDDVTWHDGMPLVAQDVQFTIDKLKEGTFASIYQENVKDITSLNIIDDHTIKINLSEDDPFFEYNLIFPIMPYHYYIDDDFVQSAKVPMGTGMYKIKDVQGTYIGIVKNDQWWNISEKNAKLDTITLNLYSSMGEVYNAFKIGNIDLIPTTNVNFSQYIGKIGFEVKDYQGREYDFLVMNLKNTVLAKKEVRQAIASAIDKNNIIATIFNNNYYIANDPLDYGNGLYSNDVGVIQFNSEAAKKILEDNGWLLQYGTWSKFENYRTLKTNFSLIVNASNVHRCAVAESIKNQLADIGIIVNIRQVSDDQYRAYLENKNYDLILAGTNLGTNPDLTRYFGNGNLANYSNDEISKIMNSIRNISDSKMIKEYYKKMQEKYQEEVPYISLYRSREYLIYSSSLVGDLSPTWYNIFYNIENWYREN